MTTADARDLKDLAMMVRRLARALRKADGANRLADLADDLLDRQGWKAEPLRRVEALPP